jgi:predicted esterase
MNRIITATLLLAACDQPEAIDFRGGCTTDPSSTSTTTGGTGEPPPFYPTPTAMCPMIVDGNVTFCPGSLFACRDVRFYNTANADGTGPLVVHYYGTYDSADTVVANSSAASALLSMAQANHGLLAFPHGDPDAASRAGNPFPWWVVCGDGVTDGCTTPDDFIVQDEVVACAIEQGLVDPARLDVSGFSAGAIMASHIVDRVGYLAGATSWSGGLPEAYQPATPAANVSVLALHGGASDVYGTYSFVDTSEAFAADVQTAGDFALLCDHMAGHADAMGPEGAEFLRLADRAGHPWAGQPIGTFGDWLVQNWCYFPGTADPNG